MPIPNKPWFRGKVTYLPSPQGTNLPVANARVRIWDKDVSGDDLLVDVKTDASGRFAAYAQRDWQDTKSIPKPWPLTGTVTVPDLTDVPVFSMTIEDPATGKSMSVPYAYVADNVELPVVVPWLKPIQLVPVMHVNSMTINQTDAPQKVWEKVKDLVEAKKKVTIRFDQGAAGLPPIPCKSNGEVDLTALRLLVCQHLGIDPNSSVLTPNPEPATLIAICVIVFILAMGSPVAIGGSLFMVILALAILLAVYYGYHVEVRRKDSVSAGTGNSVPLPLFDLEVILIPPA